MTFRTSEAVDKVRRSADKMIPIHKHRLPRKKGPLGPFFLCPLPDLESSSRQRKTPSADHLTCMRVFYSKASVQLNASVYVTISSASITAELRTIGGGKGGIRTHARLATPS